MSYNDSNIANYADDISPFSCGKHIDSVITQQEGDSEILLEWLKQNGLKANPDKFHLILSNPDDRVFIKVENYKIYNSDCEKLLGIKIDDELSFSNHVAGLCSKASQKLHALTRIPHLQSCRRFMQ